MYPDTLPPDLLRWSNLKFIKQRDSSGDEYSAECPVCSDSGHIGNDWPDRFRMFKSQTGRGARGWCRRCGYFEWADSDKNSLRPAPEEITRINAERARLADLEHARTKEKIDKLQQAAYWQGWHDAMQENHRQLWREQGIPDNLQDWFRLGYMPDKTFECGDGLHHSPALTIPFFDVGWKAVNVQYRLLKPVNEGDKYRFTAGIPAPLYLTDPDQEPYGATVIVEGAKKAIIVMVYLGMKYTVVAIPSKSPSIELFERLKDCEPIYIALDPDAYRPTKTKDGKILKPAVNRITEAINGRSRLVRLPAKPDDLFTKYGYSPKSFEKFICQATKA